MDRYAVLAPAMDVSQQNGHDVEDSSYTVFLKKGTYGDLLDVRDWLKRHGCNYVMHGRCHYIIKEFRIDEKLIGLNFRFENVRDSSMFRHFFCTPTHYDA